MRTLSSAQAIAFVGGILARCTPEHLAELRSGNRTRWHHLWTIVAAMFGSSNAADILAVFKDRLGPVPPTDDRSALAERMLRIARGQS